MNITLRNIQYHPNGDAVALLMEHALGSNFINTTQARLEEHAPAGGVWGDEEAMAEAQSVLDGTAPAEILALTTPHLIGAGFVAVLPDPAPVAETPQPLVSPDPSEEPPSL